MTRILLPTLITALFLTGTVAHATPDLPNAQPTEKQHTLEAPGPSLPDWADTQMPERPGATDAPVSQFNPPDPPPDPNPVPLDGGLGLLALAGAGFAANRLRRKQTH